MGHLEETWLPVLLYLTAEQGRKSTASALPPGRPSGEVRVHLQKRTVWYGFKSKKRSAARAIGSDAMRMHIPRGPAIYDCGTPNKAAPPLPFVELSSSANHLARLTGSRAWLKKRKEIA